MVICCCPLGGASSSGVYRMVLCRGVFPASLAKAIIEALVSRVWTHVSQVFHE